MNRDFDNLLPDDENGAALRRMQDAGDDLETPRELDFFFEFPAEINADGFVREIDDPMAVTSRHRMEERVVVCVSKVLAPTHQEINAAQARWTHLAALHHGRADGWGPVS